MEENRDMEQLKTVLVKYPNGFIIIPVNESYVVSYAIQKIKYDKGSITITYFTKREREESIVINIDNFNRFFSSNYVSTWGTIAKDGIVLHLNNGIYFAISNNSYSRNLGESVKTTFKFDTRGNDGIVNVKEKPVAKDISDEIFDSIVKILVKYDFEADDIDAVVKIYRKRTGSNFIDQTIIFSESIIEHYNNKRGN